MRALDADAAALFGLALTPEQGRAFARYTEELALWNEHTNLTAITEPQAVQVRHHLDSLALLPHLPSGECALIDVGTGAGFPGVPVRIVRPDVRLTLLEATSKKLAFVRHLSTVLGLEGVAFVHARAEEAGQDAAHRARHDVAVARAVARLPVLVEYLLPLVRVGGLAIAMKGDTAHTEAADAARALAALGGRVRAIEAYTLPDVPMPHYLILIEKVAPTPDDYPRRPGLPSQEPLV